MFSLLFMMKELYLVALVVLLVTALVVPFGMVKFSGRTIIDSLSLATRKSSGSAFYVTGALSKLPPEDAERLPGDLLDVETISGSDGLGRKYSLLHHKAVNQLAAVFGCSRTGLRCRNNLWSTPRSPRTAAGCLP